MAGRKGPTRPYNSETKDALVQLGEPELTAALLAVILDGGPQTARELEATTRYSYQSVTRGIQELVDRRWLRGTTVPQAGRGRNPARYSASASKAAIRKHYQAIFRERLGLITSRA